MLCLLAAVRHKDKMSSYRLSMFCIPAWGKRGSQTDPNASVAKTSWEDLKQSQKCPCSWQVLEQDDFKVPSSPNRSVIYDKSDFPVISSYGRITQVFCHHLHLNLLPSLLMLQHTRDSVPDTLGSFSLPLQLNNLVTIVLALSSYLPG